MATQCTAQFICLVACCTNLQQTRSKSWNLTIAWKLIVFLISDFLDSRWTETTVWVTKIRKERLETDIESEWEREREAISRRHVWRSFLVGDLELSKKWCNCNPICFRVKKTRGRAATHLPKPGLFVSWPRASSLSGPICSFFRLNSISKQAQKQPTSLNANQALSNNSAV